MMGDTDRELSDSTDNRFQDGLRNLDGFSAASMDYRQLAAMVDAMKKPVAVAKRNVINKLSRRIKMLKGKKKDGEEEGANSKSQRLVEEITSIKVMEATRISKFALANEDTVDNLSRKGKVTAHRLSLTRLAEDKSLKTFVQKWRSEHDDWKILANFMLSKNTSRHFKRSEQKRKLTKDSLLVEKELLHKRLESQVRDLTTKVDVNRPLVARTSKGKKFKKKGRDYEEEESQAPGEVEPESTPVAEEARDLAVSPQDELSGETESDRGDGGDNPDDDDLYTFNIVDDDLGTLEQEGREVTVSEADRSEPVDAKAKLMASKLFAGAANDDSSSDSDPESDDSEPDGEKTQLPTSTCDQSFAKPAVKSSQRAASAKSIAADSSSVAAATTKRSANNRKPKAKKPPGSHTDTSKDGDEGGADDTDRALQFADRLRSEMSIERPQADPEPVVEQSSEMVKTVLDIEELSRQNASVISTEVKSGKDSSGKVLSRRKKSAFFLGGVDEIDESLGTSHEEQERARKNQKVTGYKGMRDSEKKWLTSAFTESLKQSQKKNHKKKPPEGADNPEERFQKSSHQSQKFANKNSQEPNAKQGSAGAAGGKFSKQKSYEKSGAKSFTAKPQQKAKTEAPVESLHPSWQASKKRKEQLELMKKGPQGKKIKFDD